MPAEAPPVSVDALDELRRDGVVVHRGRARQTDTAAAINQRQGAINTG
jgi:hypothetical protein